MAAAEPDLESRPPPIWVAALETGVVTIGTVVVGYWLRPQDPFFVDSTFSWSAGTAGVVHLREADCSVGFPGGLSSCASFSSTPRGPMWPPSGVG